jgi:hypothetical protein
MDTGKFSVTVIWQARKNPKVESRQAKAEN